MIDFASDTFFARMPTQKSMKVSSFFCEWVKQDSPKALCNLVGEAKLGTKFMHNKLFHGDET